MLDCTSRHHADTCIYSYMHPVPGAFSERYVRRPQLLSIVLPVILLHGLNKPQTVMFATRALKDICRDNVALMSTYAEGILNVCQHKLLEEAMLVRYMQHGAFDLVLYSLVCFVEPEFSLFCLNSEKCFGFANILQLLLFS